VGLRFSEEGKRGRENRLGKEVDWLDARNSFFLRFRKKTKTKLLQPSSSSSSSSTDPERLLREAGQISLSLAVSSAFANGLGVEVAGSEAFLSLAPRWCKVKKKMPFFLSFFLSL
jgi:hypothetical protein